MSLYFKVRNSKLGQIIWPFLKRLKAKKILLRRKKEVRKIYRLPNDNKYIFYCGLCESSNMGDIAQTFCTMKWLEMNYPDYQVVACKTSVFMDERCDLVGAIRSKMKKDDFIVFQSGYNTHDLGGTEDLMHQKVILNFPETKIIMLPQTVFFNSEERKQQCSKVYNSHKKMLFLARDPISEAYSKEMFPDLEVVLYPDIVTSLIGSYDYSDAKREKVYLCRRKDVEQYYSEEDYISIKNTLSKYDIVDVSDTIISDKNKDIYKDLQGYVDNIVERFSKYRVVVTDKFHGLIFSIIAGTPVVVIKTKDHKVTSGYEWFSKIYPDLVFYADNENEIDLEVSKILDNVVYKKPDDYFKREYYDKLLGLIEKWENSDDHM